VTIVHGIGAGFSLFEKRGYLKKKAKIIGGK
jgi:hypothetical protein